MTKNTEIFFFLPLLEEREAHTNGHVVNAQRNWIPLFRTELNTQTTSQSSGVTAVRLILTCRYFSQTSQAFITQYWNAEKVQQILKKLLWWLYGIMKRYKILQSWLAKYIQPIRQFIIKLEYVHTHHSDVSALDGDLWPFEVTQGRYGRNARCVHQIPVMVQNVNVHSNLPHLPIESRTWRSRLTNVDRSGPRFRQGSTCHDTP